VNVNAAATRGEGQRSYPGRSAEAHQDSNGENPRRKARLNRQKSAETIIPARVGKGRTPNGGEILSNSQPTRRMQPTSQEAYDAERRVKPGGMHREQSLGVVRNSDQPSETETLMERMIARENLLAALQRVERNKGAPGPDGMSVGELRPYLRDNWERIKTALLSDAYKPQAVRRVEIPKPDGGVRLLGIPSVLDRFIQQAILQVLTPIFDPTFSESSFGFRPGRSAHDAVKSAREYIEEGYVWVVDIDLSKFFDRVNHDKLMARIWRRVKDKRMLHLIRRYLQAGVLFNGVVVATEEGTPQGGPLSPLLGNIMLDDLDKLLEGRGLRFCRYADDCNVYVRSQRAGERVMSSMRNFIEGRLSLRINEEKSAVAQPYTRKFLGYSFYGKNPVRFRIARKTIERLKERVREITARSNGRSMEQRLLVLGLYLRGWMQYYRLAQTPSVYRDLDGWILHRLRMCLWKQWKQYRTRLRELRALKTLPEQDCFRFAASRKGYWRMSQGPMNRAMPRRYWKSRGFVGLTECYELSVR
jgi:RNA-directed DNA polymerase